jgi:uncharacterized alkaline shock family protein YloU
MSEPSTTRAAPADGPPSGPAAEPVDVRDRGELRVGDLVVDKIARTAVLSVPGVAPVAATAGAVGRALGRTYPQVTCTRSSGRARVLVEIALVWPYPAAHVARHVCEAVTDQLDTLAGVSVDEIRATVARIVDPSDIERSAGSPREQRVR